MAVVEHKLFKEFFETVWTWAKTYVEKTYDPKHFKLPFPRGAGIKLSQKQNYAYNCYYWCCINIYYERKRRKKQHKIWDIACNMVFGNYLCFNKGIEIYFIAGSCFCYCIWCCLWYYL